MLVVVDIGVDFGIGVVGIVGIVSIVSIVCMANESREMVKERESVTIKGGGGGGSNTRGCTAYRAGSMTHSPKLPSQEIPETTNKQSNKTQSNHTQSKQRNSQSKEQS